MEREKIIDFIMFVVIICAFLGGFYLGQKIQFENDYMFYKDYISGCDCDVPLEEKGGRLSYQRDINYLNLSFNFGILGSNNHK